MEGDPCLYGSMYWRSSLKLFSITLKTSVENSQLNLNWIFLQRSADQSRSKNDLEEIRDWKCYVVSEAKFCSSHGVFSRQWHLPTAIEDSSPSVLSRHGVAVVLGHRHCLDGHCHSCNHRDPSDKRTGDRLHRLRQRQWSKCCLPKYGGPILCNFFPPNWRLCESGQNVELRQETSNEFCTLNLLQTC